VPTCAHRRYAGREFRIGAVRGKHRKPEAEHIGIAARRAALERRRAEAARALEEAEAVRDGLAAERDAAQAALAEARSLRAAIPPARALVVTPNGDEQSRLRLQAC
jgi:hypothetical protein